MAAGLVVAALILVLSGSGSGSGSGAAVVVPRDALAYVDVSLDNGRPAVAGSLALGRRFPDFPLAGAAVQGRLGAILSAGHSVDFGHEILPWVGNEAALALLNTNTSTAGSLIILDVTDRARARAFIHAQGATPQGVVHRTQLYAYASGSELAFVSHYLVVGQDASVRSAIDVAAGASPSLAASAVYQRATAGEPAGRVARAYASLAGVRRLLSPQGGVVGALGGLLYQPALQGVALSVSPTAGGARVLIASALDPALVKLNGAGTGPFVPTLQNVVPDGSILMFDVRGLSRVAPGLLNAGTTAGVAGGIGPLLSRLGVALAAEGVNVHQLADIFAGETAVAIVPRASSPTLVIVARTAHPTQVRSQLAQLEIPLAQLFKTSGAGPGRVAQFKQSQVAGVTDHQVALANGLELNYAVFNGLVVLSTSSQGVAAVAQRTRTLAQDPGFRFALGKRPAGVTSLLYLDLREVLALGQQTGLISAATLGRLRPDLEAISSVGVTARRADGRSTSRLTLRIP